MNAKVSAFKQTQRRAANALASNSTITNLQTRWQSRWQSLSADGQRVIKLSAALLAVGLVWAYLWQPASKQREALTIRIPQLQSQLATMQSEAEEIKQINAMPAVLTTNARVLADVTNLQVVFGANAKVTINESRQFVITASKTAYTDWLDHLEMALNRYRLAVVSVTLKPVEPGSVNLVDVELILADDTAAK